MAAIFYRSIKQVIPNSGFPAIQQLETLLLIQSAGCFIQIGFTQENTWNIQLPELIQISIHQLLPESLTSGGNTHNICN